jgi:acyl-CoA synthetase (AMP-forming)/AMP-acid ligase II
MEFFDRKPDETLLVDAHGGVVTPQGVDELAASLISGSKAGPKLAFLFADQSLESVARFLALLEAGIPVLPLDPRLEPAMVSDLVGRYRPDLVLTPEGSASAINDVLPEGSVADGIWRSRDPEDLQIHPGLAVLLSTSGSTGSPKLVRLTRQNIQSNARAIAKSLDLRPSDRGMTSLPIHYSFGMSVITSHLMAGSSVFVTGRSVLEREFWPELDDFGVTHLAGVPQTYAMLKRLRFEQKGLASLRALLQAGGRLAPELVAEFHTDSASKGREFFVMYGQTEASPRMACLPPDRLPEKLGSAGVPLEGGSFTIVDEQGSTRPIGERGEIVYMGPNVMVGYAQTRDDLAHGDQLGGVLHTGDLGYLDDEGFLYITGRTKRIAKVAGVRVSLDEIEARLSALGPVAATAAGDDGVMIFTTNADAALVEQARRQLARDLAAPFSLLTFRIIEDLPHLPSGKVDYAGLAPVGVDSGS